jgi:hypothetical protein
MLDAIRARNGYARNCANPSGFALVIVLVVVLVLEKRRIEDEDEDEYDRARRFDGRTR